jgi:hypothetical protein
VNSPPCCAAHLLCVSPRHPADEKGGPMGEPAFCPGTVIRAINAF